ncbi:MAG: 50S ribosomal protein L24 [Candidatus Aenigmatarchaeota archaeon]
MASKKPGKQRKRIYRAKLHKRKRLVSARLSKSLAKEMAKRSLGLRKGDEVRVMRGDHKKITGKVTKVDLKESKVYVDSLKRKKVSGEEVVIPIHASNLMIIKADMADKKRQRAIRRAK